MTITFFKMSFYTTEECQSYWFGMTLGCVNDDETVIFG